MNYTPTRQEYNSSGKKKICPRCKAHFLCFDEDCWCSKLPHVMPVPENEGCLCPDCLKIEIEKKVSIK